MGCSLSVFAGRKAVLATMHGKATAIAPVFRERLGIEIIVPTDLDTDQFGTFTGETERRGSMDDALLAKASLGFERTGLDLALASEGSFGPHPQVPFLAVGLEKLLLLDRISGLAATEQYVDLTPCYANWETRSLMEIESQIIAKRFPHQAMTVRPNAGGDGPQHKGIQNAEMLATAIREAAARSIDGLAFVQTDMRAHLNPRRMHAINMVAVMLADRLREACPHCAAPGWGVKRTERGLPCSGCEAATDWILSEVFGCFMCDSETSQPRSDGLTEADPAHCPYCNP